MIENWTDQQGAEYLQTAGMKYLEDMEAAYKAGALDAGIGAQVLRNIKFKLEPMLKRMELDFRFEQDNIRYNRK